MCGLVEMEWAFFDKFLRVFPSQASLMVVDRVFPSLVIIFKILANSLSTIKSRLSVIPSSFSFASLVWYAIPSPEHKPDFRLFCNHEDVSGLFSKKW